VGGGGSGTGPSREQYLYITWGILKYVKKLGCLDKKVSRSSVEY
jgi:hypothetical protein